MAPPTIVTGRLVLRPMSADDLDALAELHAEESFWHFPWRRGWTRDETEAFLHRTMAAYDDPGLGISAVEVASTAELAGWAGLSVPSFLPEVLPAIEVGWRLGERYRGHGYATEAGAAWVRYAFEVLDVDSLLSIYEPENAASSAVMRRLGFRLDLVTRHPNLAVPLHVMSLTSETWMSAREILW